MLKQRIVTAIAMLAVLLPALFYSTPFPFCLVALVMIAAGGWEWGRLNGCGQSLSVCLAFATALLCALSWYLGWLEKPLQTLWVVVGAAWVLGGSWLLYQGVPSWTRIPKSLRLTGGVVVLFLAWLAIAQARVMGINFLLSVLLLVWAADIFAYFAGRALGGRFSKSKLAPSISPGKSWEGVWGGMAGVVVLAFAWLALDRYTTSFGGSLYARLWDQHGAIVTLLSVVFLAAMSVLGDLVESLIKRSAGAKDSSGLLPGHGGVLDRVDALLPTLPLAMMLVSL